MVSWWSGTCQASFQGPRGPIIGPTVEIDVTEKISVEASAIHRTLRRTSESVFADGTSFQLQHSSPSWEFPVVAKYRFLVGPVTPFVEAGPAFRLTQILLAGASPYGAAVGGGLEGRLDEVTVAPRIRYTLWKQDRQGGDDQLRRTKLDILVSLTL